MVKGMLFFSLWGVGAATLENGCCVDDNDTFINLSYALHIDLGYEQIPYDVRPSCESEWHGYKAIAVSEDPQEHDQVAQHVSVNCGKVTFTTFESTRPFVSYFIVDDNNGTVTCNPLSTLSLAQRNRQKTRECFGKEGSTFPTYVGPVFYGSLKAGRFRGSNSYADVDVGGRCLPIVESLEGDIRHFTNVEIKELPPSIFDIPAPCAKAAKSVMV